MAEKKRIREWEQEFQIQILDIDGFDQRDPHLFERLFTKQEFESAIASCTIAQSRIAGNHTERNSLQRKQPETVAKSNTTTIEDVHRKRTWKFRAIQKRYIAFTLPALCTFLLWKLYQAVKNKIQIRWYWPLGFGLITLFIILLEPITPLVAGPLYLWYLLFSGITMTVLQLYWHLAHILLHQNLPVMLNEPFLSTVNLFGNPVSLYFSIGKALTSSIVIAILIVCIRDLISRLGSRKSAP